MAALGQISLPVLFDGLFHIDNSNTFGFMLTNGNRPHNSILWHILSRGMSRLADDLQATRIRLT